MYVVTWSFLLVRSAGIAAERQPRSSRGLKVRLRPRGQLYISCIHSGASLGTANAFSSNKYAYRKLQRHHLTPVRRRFAIFHHPGTRFRFDSIPTHWPESLAAKRLGYLRAASWRSQFFRYSFRGTRFWIERTCRPTPTRQIPNSAKSGVGLRLRLRHGLSFLSSARVFHG